MAAVCLQKPHLYCCQTFKEIEKNSSDYRLIQIAKMCFFYLASMLTYPIYFLGKLLSSRTAAEPAVRAPAPQTASIPTETIQAPASVEVEQVKPCWDKTPNEIRQEYYRICAEFPLLYPDDHKGVFAKGRQVRDQDQANGNETVAQRKNRYGDILPNEATRVQDLEDPEFYYNANWVLEESAIACQGPTEASIEDFWQMIWSANVCRITMVTDLMQGDEEKCARYWPLITGRGTGEVLRFSNGLFVGPLREDEYMVDKQIVVRCFTLMKGGAGRIVIQTQLRGWNDHEVTSLETLKTLIRMLLNTENEGLLAVHCSAGVGRTGTTLAIYETMKRIQKGENGPDLIANVVRDLRNPETGRNGMVLNLEQYQLIYDTVRELNLPQ